MSGNIIHGDALTVLRDMPGESVSMIFTDPPFGISNEVTITRTGNPMKFKSTTDLVSNFGAWDKFASMQEFLSFTWKWVAECDRILKPGGAFISWFDRDKINFLSRWLQLRGYKLRGYIADCLSNPVPSARKVQWQSGWSMLGIWTKPGAHHVYKWEEGQHPDYCFRGIVGGNERIKNDNGETAHPCQKPEAVIQDIILWWSNPGDTICDSFCGVGSIPYVAHKLGRNYIGIELNPHYAEIARARIAAEESQLKMNLDFGGSA